MAGWANQRYASAGPGPYPPQGQAPGQFTPGVYVLPQGFAPVPIEIGRANGRALTSLILGIVSVVTFLIPWLYLITSLVGGIVAIVLGNDAANSLERAPAPNRRSMAVAGRILGIIGTSLAVLSAIVGMLLYS
ncbi:DUF4190 domain-containing protein [Aestuariimicrobium kwangyangense]|uniref:DUF4190 domain-containing protein n=1 Tax=Aestuariimicrobium kwangyangense TaxID=396389 RepID=UPI0012FBA581|nr:DUF4190 domain-containing protein [Aestuariimicrobium kwangyangense]